MKPEPIYKDGSIEIIPLPGNCSVHVTAFRHGGRHASLCGYDLERAARATHAELTAQAERIAELQRMIGALRSYAISVIVETDYRPYEEARAHAESRFNDFMQAFEATQSKRKASPTGAGSD